MNSSVYIPRIGKYITDAHIVEEFYNNWFGHVNRVDFVPIGKKPGFTEEDIDANYKSAFVHFTRFHEVHPFAEAFSQDQPYKFIPRFSRDFWLILPNKSPVPQTMMNNAQIVENCRYLENKVKELEDKIEGIQFTVHQLIMGLFNEETQNNQMRRELNTLFSDENRYKYQSKDDTSRWTSYPTTRQGDECEARINALEEQIKALTTFDNERVFQEEDEYADAEDNDEEASSSTHSSMPDLEEVYSISSSEVNERRIRNSYDLCGNA